MFDIGWSEMAVIALVALVILGPKELPQAMRTFANFMKSMRRYAQEFRAGVDNIVREAELEDARKALETARKANPKNLIRDMVDPTGEVTEEIKSVEATARGDGTRDGAKGGSGKSGEAKSGEEQGGSKALPSAAAAGAAGAVSAGEGKAEDEPKANGAKIVSEPFVMAPPHSLRPPAPEPLEAQSQAEEPVAERPPLEGNEAAKRSDKPA